STPSGSIHQRPSRSGTIAAVARSNGYDGSGQTNSPTFGRLYQPCCTVMCRTSTVWQAGANRPPCSSRAAASRTVAGTRCAQPDVVDMLGGNQLLEELDGRRGPPGRGTGQLLQHRGGTLAPAEPDRVGHPGPVGERGRAGQRVHPAYADQIADVRHGPL